MSRDRFGSTPGRMALALAAYLLLAGLVLGLSPLFGAERLDFGQALAGLFADGPARESIDAALFWRHRVPRCLLAFLVGGALGIAGAGLQAVLANPLAEPFVLGVAGAGAVGAVSALLLPWLHASFGPLGTVQLLALAGSLVALAAIFRLADGPAGLSPATVLLAGVTINILCGAVILLLRYLARPDVLVSMDRWLMGGLSVLGYREIAALLPLALPGAGLLLWLAPALNQLGFGRELAMAQGVAVDRVQRLALLGAGLCTAGAVSLAGPIGFVGLMAPHAVRRFSGPDHRLLLPGSFLLGGALLTFCDTSARTLMAPAELPVGVVTALLGGPFFLALLHKTRGAAL